LRRIGTDRLVIFLTVFLAGCTPGHYKKSADKEVYGSISQKEMIVLGKTNAFTVDTRYSHRSPDEIAVSEIKDERLVSALRKISLSDALAIAVTNSRNYQFRKENLYLAALSLSRDRYDFKPKFFGGTTASLNRDSDARYSGRVSPQMGVDQLLKSGASLGVTLANDIFRYYTGDPKRTATTLISANLVQPLLRGAGSSIVAENLTQSERNLVYEIRAFTRFQKSFALEIVAAYYRLLQQRDTIRNEFANFKTLGVARDRAENMAENVPKYQADQARQDELRAQSRYILAVQSYQARLDSFKQLLGLPLGFEIGLDETALEELNKAGFIDLGLDEISAYKIAVEQRLDLMNEIDRFEDSKRKIKVAANQLKADVNIFADYALQSEGPSDYANFNFDRYRGGVGVQLNLPFDRLRERNNFRASLISFERQLRALSLALDDTRSDVRDGFRSLLQASQNYEIQKSAMVLATNRVESAQLLFEAGRAQIRDLLEAQSAELQAKNAVTQTLIDYHLSRLTLFLDLEVLDTDKEHFWVARHTLQGAADSTGTTPIIREVVSPSELFKEP